MKPSQLNSANQSWSSMSNVRIQLMTIINGGFSSTIASPSLLPWLGYRWVLIRVALNANVSLSYVHRSVHVRMYQVCYGTQLFLTKKVLASGRPLYFTRMRQGAAGVVQDLYNNYSRVEKKHSYVAVQFHTHTNECTCLLGDMTRVNHEGSLSLHRDHCFG